MKQPPTPQEAKALWRTFWISFSVALLAALLLLSLVWVDLTAHRSGFDGFLPTLRCEWQSDAVLRIQTAAGAWSLDLSPLQGAAALLHSIESRCLPPDLRFLSRGAQSAQHWWEQRALKQREQEYYKNAGLV